MSIKSLPRDAGDRGRNEGPQFQTTFYSKMSSVVKWVEDHPEQRYDLVCVTYTLSDLPSDKVRLAATQLLFELLNENGLLLIIEAGNPRGSHTVRTARQLLLDMFSKQRSDLKDKPMSKAMRRGGKKAFQEDNDGESAASPPPRVSWVLPPPPPFSSHEQYRAKVVSPCTHDKPCPLHGASWCSFSQKVGV